MDRERKKGEEIATEVEIYQQRRIERLVQKVMALREDLKEREEDVIALREQLNAREEALIALHEQLKEEKKKRENLRDHSRNRIH